MTFENTIKKISAICASLVLFIMALSFYLGAKGFTMDADGNISLVTNAVAKEVKTTEVIEKNETGDTLDIAIDVPHFMGKEDAPITMYEYSSFACSHCSVFHLNTLPQLKKDFVDTGKLKIVFVDFPLDKKSMQAAMLSYCIPAEGYFDFLNILFKNQMEWGFSSKSEKIFTNYASLFDISAKKAEECMKDEKVQSRILANRQQALEKLKIQGTPSFVISNKGKKQVLQGASSYEDFKKIINTMLDEQQ